MRGMGARSDGLIVWARQGFGCGRGRVLKAGEVRCVAIFLVYVLFIGDRGD